MMTKMNVTVAAGGGLAHPSVIACSWYMKLCRRVLLVCRPAAEESAPARPKPPKPPRLAPPPSVSWNVAYGEMSSAVSVTHHNRHCLPFKSRQTNSTGNYYQQLPVLLFHLPFVNNSYRTTELNEFKQVA